jgi:RNA polymerase sigma-70 factor (ECF subfamily)
MAHMPDELIPTRATLIQRLKNWQDQGSWQEFFDTYWNLIYGVAVRGGLSKTEAQDVVQETMIAVAKYMPSFKYDPALGSFKAWLLNMTRWRITDQLRKRGPAADPQAAAELTEKNVLHHNLDAELAQMNSDLDKLWDEEWENNLLQTAIAKARREVDPKQYQIFDCYVNKDWAPERVAKAFAISTTQVYLAKHRVTEKIRQEVEKLNNGLV